MEGWTPTPVLGTPASGAGNPSWVPGGPSPNPSGRPKGIPDKRQVVTDQVLSELQAIVGALIGKALEGDSNSASILLSKVLPSVKAQTEKVQFDFDVDAPVSAQIAQVVQAVSEGRLAPDVGRLICDSIGVLANARGIEELEARMAKFEETRDARAQN
jgi:hypothetical protein